MSDTLRDIRDLLERAIYDLERGWVEAALDALGRARHLAQATDEAPRRD